MDPNFWKEAYKEQWAAASVKEDFVKKILETQTGLTVEVIGLGAGTTDFISGSAATNNKTKGDADLYLPEREIYVEVTGPNIPVAAIDTLWLRPDKVQNSINKIRAKDGKLHTVVHIAEIKPNRNKLARVIVLHKVFFDGIRNKEINLISPRIRGIVETYYEVPANHASVILLEQFIENIKADIYK